MIRLDIWVMLAYCLGGAAVAVAEDEPGVTLRGFIAVALIFVALNLVEWRAGKGE